MSATRWFLCMASFPFAKGASPSPRPAATPGHVARARRHRRGVRRFEVAGLGRSGGGAGRRSARARALGCRSLAAVAAWGAGGRDGWDGRLHRDSAGGSVGGPGIRPLRRGGRLVWHAAWDFAHFRADKVVSRSVAEWCTVFDVLRAVGILILPMP
jgi:hypothetical protein